MILLATGRAARIAKAAFDLAMFDSLVERNPLGARLDLVAGLQEDCSRARITCRADNTFSSERHQIEDDCRLQFPTEGLVQRLLSAGGSVFVVGVLPGRGTVPYLFFAADLFSLTINSLGSHSRASHSASMTVRLIDFHSPLERSCTVEYRMPVCFASQYNDCARSSSSSVIRTLIIGRLIIHKYWL